MPYKVSIKLGRVRRAHNQFYIGGLTSQIFCLLEGDKNLPRSVGLQKKVDVEFLGKSGSLVGI
jgi:hypothetical protein